jgi:hypothetical protein
VSERVMPARNVSGICTRQNFYTSVPKRAMLLQCLGWLYVNIQCGSIRFFVSQYSSVPGSARIG